MYTVYAMQRAHMTCSMHAQRALVHYMQQVLTAAAASANFSAPMRWNPNGREHHLPWRRTGVSVNPPALIHLAIYLTAGKCRHGGALRFPQVSDEVARYVTTT